MEEPIHDYGVVYRDEHDTTDHTYTIQNLGDENLKIEKIKSSCGCTRADITRKVIPPGETADLLAQLRFKSSTGKNRIRVTLLTNDPKKSRLDLGL